MCDWYSQRIFRIFCDKVERNWTFFFFCFSHNQNFFSYFLSQEAIESSYCQRIYLTEIDKEFESDAFFPAFDRSKYSLIRYNIWVQYITRSE